MKGLWNEVRWMWQRAIRGHDERLFWAMDEYLNPIIVAGLKNLKENGFGYPSNLKSQSEWRKVLNKMIYSFEYDKFEFPLRKYMKDSKKREEGLELFAKYYHNLWD